MLHQFTNNISLKNVYMRQMTKFVLYICRYKMIQCTADLDRDRKGFYVT
jgi:hypothetical protein